MMGWGLRLGEAMRCTGLQGDCLELWVKRLALRLALGIVLHELGLYQSACCWVVSL